MATKALIVGVGAERGLGAQLALRFAREGLAVHVAGRTAERLEAVVAQVRAAGGTAHAIVADATDEAQVGAMFARVGDGLDLVVYNAGNNTPGRIVDMDADYFAQSWRLVCFGGFLVGREALRRMLPGRRGTILFTGASASLRGRPGFGAFNSAKSALRILAQAMAKEVAPEGIHVGHVVVDGGIHGERLLARRPDVLARVGEDGLISLEGIVDAYVYLYRQGPRAWTFELDLRTSRESW
ncbi:MAG: SDR family NAD(P)-dependent oxidoreductase [Burkholderiales bacterium]|nr:SDR family NAD(P)-dependent oxidoreductase [Burkholderiales bacterium]